MPEDTHEDIRRRLFDAAWEIPAFPPAAAQTVARARRRAATTIGGAVLAAIAAIAIVSASLPFIDRAENTGRRPGGEVEDREFFVDLASGTRTEIRAFPRDAWGFEWSPVADLLTFVSGVGGKPQVWISELDGSNARPVTDDPLEAVNANWSPSGRELVYVGFGGGTTRGLFIVDVNSGDTRLFLRGSRDPWNPEWSPDGTRILYHVSIKGKAPGGNWSDGIGLGRAASRRIEVADVSTGRATIVAGNAKNAAFDGSWLSNERIVFMRGADVRVDGPARHALWTARWDGTSRRPVVSIPSGNYAWEARPSPDGSLIAYAAVINSDDRVIIYDIATGTRRTIGLGWYSVWIDDDTLLVQRRMES